MSLILAALLALSPAAAGSPLQGAPPAKAAQPVPLWSEDDAEAPPTPEQKAAKAAYQKYMLSLIRTLRASAQPRDRALATQMGWMPAVMGGRTPTPAEQAIDGAMLRAAAEAAPDDALLQQLWSHAIPEASGCDARKPCLERSRAQVRLQPDNAIAWMPVVDAAWKAKDVAATESALAQMARATYSDDQIGEATKAWMEVFKRHPMPAPPPGVEEANEGREASEFRLAMAFAVSGSIGFGSISQACHHEWHPDAAPSRFRDCARIGRLLLDHSKSLLSRQMGRALLRISGQATPDDVAAARVAEWQYQQWGKLNDDTDPEKTQALVADWLATWNEVAVLERQLERAGIPLTPPADWQPRGRDGKPISPLGQPPAIQTAPPKR